MSKLLQHMDEMSAILTHTTKNEQSLVKALGDALRQVDDQLVHEIRNLNTQHQARRAEIFLELQALACSIGLFPTAQEIPHVPAANDAHAHGQFIPVGDWRQAAQNINYQDELDFHLKTVGGQQ
jgi:hypothetical protein